MRKSVSNLKRPSYRTVPKDIIRMNDNSNLFIPNPAAARVARKFNYDSLAAYPPVAADELRNALGEKYEIPADQIIIGNGSDEIIDLVVKTYCNPKDRATISVPTFEMYSMYVTIAGGRIVECPLKKNFQLDIEKILSSSPKIIFIASPNNPTGNSMNKKDVLRIANEADSIVVIDEAYCDFVRGMEFASYVNEFDNLLILRTFSKAYALPGLRVGFGIGSKKVVREMMIVGSPFRLNRFSEEVAIEALKDDRFVEKTAAMARRERSWLSKELERLGAKVYPSETNFILFKSPIPLKRLLKELMNKKIAIRDCSGQPLLNNCARVTFGRHEINERFVSAMDEIIGGNR